MDGIDTGIDTVFDYPLFYAVRSAFAQGKPLGELVAVLNEDLLYAAPDALVTLIGSHDVRRFMSDSGATVEGLKLAATFLLTARGTPVWYYGDEIAMRGGEDPDNRRDFPGGWAGDPRNAFERAGRTAEEQAVWAHVRALMHLRRDLEPLRRGSMLHLAVTEQSYVFARVTQQRSVIVALNNAAGPSTIEALVEPAGLADGVTLRDRLGVVSPIRVAGGKIRLTLPPRSSAVFSID